MEIDQLTDEQIANLTPEQITDLENNPEKLEEILGKQAAEDEPEQEVKEGAANGAGEDEDPVVLNKSGKGTIPYEKHKELRVENSSLREQLQTAKAEGARAAAEANELLKLRDEAKGKDVAKADDAINAHMAVIKDDYPELHQAMTYVLEKSQKQGDTLEKTIAELKREREEMTKARELTTAEEVAEAKDGNPDLSHWENNDPEAWDEAKRQDEILRNTSKWGHKPYAERFEEVARRVRAIMPEASAPQKPADPDATKASAKAKVEKAPVRKPTTLSDISGGANPASEREQLENLSPHELTAKLMKMSAAQSSVLRSGLD